MYKYFLLLCWVIGVQAMAQSPKKNITLEDIYKNGTFTMKDVPGFNAMKDGRRYSELYEHGDTQMIRICDLVTGKQQAIVFNNLQSTAEGGRSLKVNGYQFSEQEDMLLIFTENQNIYRRSVLSRVYVYNLKSRILFPLDNQKVLHATFSPAGDKVAFVKQNNLFYMDLVTGSTQQVTFDGEQNRIINGSCDWVYEEEFSFSRAFEWSKSGRYIAYYRFDEREVPYFTMSKFNGLYPEPYTFRYPKAGEKNSIVSISIYNTKNGKTINGDVGKITDQYIPRIKWTTADNELCIYRLNRLQNKLELLLTDASTGKSSIIYEERNDKYVNINDEVHFLPDGKSLIISSEKSGYNHLYHYDWQNKKMNDLTPGNYDIAGLVGVNEEKGVVYYTAAKNSPTEKTFHAVTIKGGERKNLTPEKGTHVITPCTGNSYFLDRYSRITKVPVYRLIDANGNIVRVLEDNSNLRELMAGYALGNVQLFQVKGVKTKLNAWMITPPDFDSSKKYPVLMYQYSGPGSQEAADRFPIGNYWWHQMLAEKGYIIVCVDGTGTGYRGEAFCKKTYLQLGKYESEDQIAAAKSLSTLPYVDKNRIGIWGWSYGGFMSSTCIMKGNDIFKAAIAVAPVTNWRYYDNIYTERYMRTPKENAEGYDSNSPEYMVSLLKGKFLLVHGTADDNVHFQNSAMLVSALVKADKEYDSEFYPDKNHGISGGNTRLHLFRRMTEFILNNL